MKSGMQEIVNPDFITTYRDLKAFKRAYVLALEMHKASLQFPKIEQYALGDQLRRASKSICANIAEGFTRQRDSRAEWKRFLLIAIASGEEAQTWCDFAKDLNYIENDTYILWCNELNIIAKMLYKLRESGND